MKELAKIALVATVSMAAALPASAIQKCTGPSGKVSFQDAPCANGRGEKLTVRPASGQGAGSTATADAEGRVQKIKSDNEMAEAIRTQKPLVGMTVAQLNEAMGPATKVNADNYNGTQREQVIFERPSESWYVYTRNGKVESIQHRPGAPLGEPQMKSSGRCPSSLEINNAITSASSMTLSDAERSARWQAIRALQACGKS